MRKQRPTTCFVASQVHPQSAREPEMVRPWQSLPEERKAQIAKVVAELLWRMRPRSRSAKVDSHAEQTNSVLDKAAKSVHFSMKSDLRNVFLAPGRKEAETAIDLFIEKYRAKYGPAVDCLIKDRSAMLELYDFSDEHWTHLRTTKPIESVSATVRHRTVRTKGALSSKTAKLMVFKLIDAASKTWRRWKGTNQLPKIIAGVRFADGIEVIQPIESRAA